MKYQNKYLFAAVASILTISSSVDLACSATIIENFESSSAGSGTPPTGWSFINVTGAPSYGTSAAGAGSDGSGGSSGLAGNVSSTAFVSNQLAGGYLVSDSTFNLNNSVSGTFDFQIVHESTFDDITFMLGDIADGYNETGSGDGSAGELLNAKFTEAVSTGVSSLLTNGLGDAGRLDSTGITLVDDTWYRATVTWTPTSGLTGDFSITVNDFSSDVYTLATTAFTFDSADGHLGFGSVNDTIRFDNVNFTGTAIPEPSSILLSGLALVGLALRRRR